MRNARFVLALVAVAVVTLIASAQPSMAQSKIEKLLSEAGIPSAKLQDGVYKAAYTVQNKTETIIVRELQLGEQPNDSLKLIQLLVPLFSFEKGTKIPAPAASKINELNSDLTVGKIVVWPDGVLYASTLYYVTANADTLDTDMVLATLNAGAARDAIKPFFQE